MDSNNINMKIKNAKKTKGYVMIFIAGILWGTIGLFVKLLNNLGASIGLTAFMRLFMGFTILIPILFFMGGIKMFKIDKKTLLNCLVLGTFTQAMFNYFYHLCIGTVGVATASILLYTSPVFVSILSYVLFKESINKQKVIALVMNIIGCFLMVTGGNLDNLKISFLGIIFGLVSAFLYSLIAIIGNIVSDDVHPLTVVFYSFLFGWITLSAFTRPWEVIPKISSIHFWIYSFGFGLIPTVGSYFFYMGGLRNNLELSKVPIIASVETVVATILGVFVFRENIGLINLLGMLTLILSIAFMNYKFKNKNT